MSRAEDLARLVLRGATPGESAAAAQALAKETLRRAEPERPQPKPSPHRPTEYDDLRSEVIRLREENATLRTGFDLVGWVKEARAPTGGQLRPRMTVEGGDEFGDVIRQRVHMGDPMKKLAVFVRLGQWTDDTEEELQR